MDLNGVSGLLRELQARKAEVTEAAPVFVFVVFLGEAGRKTTPFVLPGSVFLLLHAQDEETLGSLPPCALTFLFHRTARAR